MSINTIQYNTILYRYRDRYRKYMCVLSIWYIGTYYVGVYVHASCMPVRRISKGGGLIWEKVDLSLKGGLWGKQDDLFPYSLCSF